MASGSTKAGETYPLSGAGPGLVKAGAAWYFPHVDNNHQTCTLADSHLLACHECAALVRHVPLPKDGVASCRRCGAELYRHLPDSINRALALYLASLGIWVIANVYPFLSLKVGGIVERNLLITGAWALYRNGMGELGLVVVLTSIVFPFIVIAGMVYLLLPVRLGYVPWHVGRVYRVIRTLQPWSLVGVFMLGTLISIVKLRDLADVLPGISLYAFIALLLVFNFASAAFDPHEFWCRVSSHRMTPDDLTTDRKVLHCHTCDGVQQDGDRCKRCDAPMHHRIENSLQQTWALTIAASLMLIPANIYPVMTVKKLGKGSPDTILSGITKLIEGGLYGLALIVLVASIVVPFAKIGALVFLMTSVERRSNWRPRDRTLLYRVTEIVGSWSMVDVYLVGILAGLVSLGVLASVTPGIGATFFGAAVILTMLAAQRFDPRLIWDHADESSAAQQRAGSPDE